MKPKLTVVALFSLLACSCSTAGAHQGAAASASAACQTAVAEVNRMLVSASAAAAGKPNPNYGKPAPSGDLGAEISSNLARVDEDPAAARQDALLASYVIVQHALCFPDATVAEAQLIIDQSKPK